MGDKRRQKKRKKNKSKEKEFMKIDTEVDINPESLTHIY